MEESGMSEAEDTTSPQGRDRLKAYLPYLAPALLVVVALTQITVAKTTDLTSWKGGGFGMFATIERRVFRFYAIDSTGATPIRPRRVGRVLQTTRNFPSRSNLESLAQQVARRAGRQFPELTAVRVEVWRGVFDGESWALSAELLRDLTYELPDSDF
jgi:hypothetical protein